MLRKTLFIYVFVVAVVLFSGVAGAQMGAAVGAAVSVAGDEAPGGVAGASDGSDSAAGEVSGVGVNSPDDGAAASDSKAGASGKGAEAMVSGSDIDSTETESTTSKTTSTEPTEKNISASDEKNLTASEPTILKTTASDSESPKTTATDSADKNITATESTTSKTTSTEPTDTNITATDEKNLTASEPTTLKTTASDSESPKTTATDSTDTNITSSGSVSDSSDGVACGDSGYGVTDGAGALGASGTQGFPLRDGYMTLMAGGALEYSEAEPVYHVSGGVKISFASYVIETERISIDTEKKTVVADQPFTMDVGRLEFRGESFRYFYEDERGALQKVTSSIEGANFKAESVDFGSVRGVVLNNVVVTTCCFENMDYHVEAKTLELLPDNRAKLKGVSLYFRKKKIFKWPTYTMKLGDYGEASSGAAVGGWFFSAPTLGYSDYGGVEASTEVKHVSVKKNMIGGLYLDYFARDGLFPEARVDGVIGEGYRYAVRYGKRYKENTGYFRYFPPVIVWNSPVLEFQKEDTAVRGTKLLASGSFEIGRMKEAHLRKPLDRAFMNVQAKYPLSGRRRWVRFSLLGDARYGAYRRYKEYRLWGSGVEMTFGDEERRSLRLQYMTFRGAGRTPFYSDLVNTNSKLFGYGVVKFSGKYSLMVDAQYDLERKKFDEVVYSAIRSYECLRFFVSWRTEVQSLGLSLQVLTPGAKKK